MIDDIRLLVDQYRKWLEQETSLREIDDWVEITTPYLDRHNDYLQIYARRQGNGYILTDDSYIIEDLEQSGCRLDTPRRQGLVDMTLRGFGVGISKDTRALEVKASRGTFALQKHNLIQAMLAVNDLFYLSSSTIRRLFTEDVAAWLDVSDIRYTPSVKLSGTSGFDHRFDFVIPKSRSRPERLLRAINRPNRENTQSTVFSWIDTHNARAAGSCAYAILNDTDQQIPSNVEDALQSYDVRPVLWSKREESREELAA